MSVYDYIIKLLEDSKSSSNVVKKVTALPDNYILVDCNFARVAKLHVVDNTVYIEADNELKTKLKQLIDKLLNAKGE